MNQQNKLFDPTGRGLKDIEKKEINTILAADQSFSEDPIRILRAIYFSTKLQFTLSEEILNAIPCNAKLLLDEKQAGKMSFWLNKILSGSHAGENAVLLLKLGVLAKIVPELAHVFDPNNSAMIELISRLYQNNAARKWPIKSSEILATLLVSCGISLPDIVKIIDNNVILSTYRARNYALLCLINRTFSIQQQQAQQPVPHYYSNQKKQGSLKQSRD